MIRKKHIAIFILIAVFSLFFSCNQMQEISIEERIDMFFDDVNNNPSDVYTNYHPDAPNYNNIKDYNNTLGNVLPTGNNYSHGAVVVNGEQATTTVTGGTYTNEPIVFNMKKGDDGWYIWDTTINGSTY